MPQLRGGRGDATKRLLQLLALRETDDRGEPFVTSRTWQTFAAVCDTHQLIPFIYCRLQQLTQNGIPPELGEYLRARFLPACAHNFHLATKLVSLISQLEAEGVSTLTFKGPSLAMAVYGGLSFRQCNDLDLVVRKDQLLKGARLMKAWGFQATPMPARPQISPYLCHPENSRHLERGKEIQFRSPDGTFYVDFHWHLADRYWRPYTPEVDRLWDRAAKQDLPQGSVLAPCREDLFLALCAHGTRHRWCCLKWLLDVAQLLRGAGTLDWSRIEEMTRLRPGVSAAANVAVILVRELLEVPVPPEVDRILPTTPRTATLATAVREELLLQGQTSGDEHTTLLAIEGRSSARWQYRAVRIFRYPESLFRQIILEVDPKDRRLIRLPQNLQFLYHFIRPARLIVVHSLRAVRMLWRTGG